MTALGYAIITFVCTVVCAVLGTTFRTWLPEPHLNKESQDVIRLGMGLVATMTALLLGLVTAAAKGSFDTYDVSVKNTAAGIMSLDRLLARYGPETRPSRDLLTQRWLKTEALKLTEEVVRTRFRLLGSATGAVPRALLAVVIFWLSMTFASFGLSAPRNATVVTVLVISALSVAAAVFLILELDGPFEGLIRISGEPLRFALANLDS